MKSQFMVENGKAYYMARNGKKVELGLTEEIVSMCKPASEIKAQVEEAKAVITTPAAKAPAFEGKGHAVIDSELIGFPGVLKGDNKLYYLVCTHCGMITSPAQARYSIANGGRVTCIYCQRQIMAGKDPFKMPEHKTDKKDIDWSKVKPCEATGCTKKVTGGHIAVSLAVTGGKYKLCTCHLQGYAQTKAYNNDMDSSPVVSGDAIEEGLPMFDGAVGVQG